MALILKEGVVWKESGQISATTTWEKRWLVLRTDGTLLKFSSRAHTKPNRIIHLGPPDSNPTFKVTVQEAPEKVESLDRALRSTSASSRPSSILYPFKLATPEKTFYFAAESKQMQSYWIISLEQMIHKMKEEADLMQTRRPDLSQQQNALVSPPLSARGRPTPQNNIGSSSSAALVSSLSMWGLESNQKSFVGMGASFTALVRELASALYDAAVDAYFELEKNKTLHKEDVERFQTRLQDVIRKHVAHGAAAAAAQHMSGVPIKSSSGIHDSLNNSEISAFHSSSSFSSISDALFDQHSSVLPSSSSEKMRRRTMTINRSSSASGAGPFGTPPAPSSLQQQPHQQEDLFKALTNAFASFADDDIDEEVWNNKKASISSNSNSGKGSATNSGRVSPVSNNTKPSAKPPQSSMPLSEANAVHPLMLGAEAFFASSEKKPPLSPASSSSSSASASANRHRRTQTLSSLPSSSSSPSSSAGISSYADDSSIMPAAIGSSSSSISSSSSSVGGSLKQLARSSPSAIASAADQLKSEGLQSLVKLLDRPDDLDSVTYIEMCCRFAQLRLKLCEKKIEINTSQQLFLKGKRKESKIAGLEPFMSSEDVKSRWNSEFMANGYVLKVKKELIAIASELDILADKLQPYLILTLQKVEDTLSARLNQLKIQEKVIMDHLGMNKSNGSINSHRLLHVSDEGELQEEEPMEQKEKKTRLLTSLSMLPPLWSLVPDWPRIEVSMTTSVEDDASPINISLHLLELDKSYRSQIGQLDLQIILKEQTIVRLKLEMFREKMSAMAKDANLVTCSPDDLNRKLEDEFFSACSKSSSSLSSLSFSSASSSSSQSTTTSFFNQDVMQIVYPVLIMLEQLELERQRIYRQNVDEIIQSLLLVKNSVQRELNQNSIHYREISSRLQAYERRTAAAAAAANTVVASPIRPSASATLAAALRSSSISSPLLRSTLEEMDLQRDMLRQRVRLEIAKKRGDACARLLELIWQYSNWTESLVAASGASASTFSLRIPHLSPTISHLERLKEREKSSHLNSNNNSSNQSSASAAPSSVLEPPSAPLPPAAAAPVSALAATFTPVIPGGAAPFQYVHHILKCTEIPLIPNDLMAITTSAVPKSASSHLQDDHNSSSSSNNGGSSPVDAAVKRVQNTVKRYSLGSSLFASPLMYASNFHSPSSSSEPADPTPTPVSVPVPVPALSSSPNVAPFIPRSSFGAAALPVVPVVYPSPPNSASSQKISRPISTSLLPFSSLVFESEKEEAEAESAQSVTKLIKTGGFPLRFLLPSADGIAVDDVSGELLAIHKKLLRRSLLKMVINSLNCHSALFLSALLFRFEHDPIVTSCRQSIADLESDLSSFDFLQTVEREWEKREQMEKNSRRRSSLALINNSSNRFNPQGSGYSNSSNNGSAAQIKYIRELVFSLASPPNTPNSQPSSAVSRFIKNFIGKCDLDIRIGMKSSAIPSSSSSSSSSAQSSPISDEYFASSPSAPASVSSSAPPSESTAIIVPLPLPEDDELLNLADFVNELVNYISEKHDKELMQITISSSAQQVNIQGEIYEALEKFLFETEKGILYDACLARALCIDEDSILNGQYSIFASKGQSDFLIAEKYQSDEAANPYESAVSCLQHIPSMRTPTSKLKCVLAASRAVYTRMEEICTSEGDNGPVESIASDEFLPVWIYCCFTAQVPNLFTELKFIRTFASKEHALHSEAEYYLSSLELAAEYLKTLTMERMEADVAADRMQKEARQRRKAAAAAAMEEKKKLSEQEEGVAADAPVAPQQSVEHFAEAEVEREKQSK